MTISKATEIARDTNIAEQNVEQNVEENIVENVEPEIVAEINKINQGESNEEFNRENESRGRGEENRTEQTGNSETETKNQERQIEDEGDGSRSEKTSATGEKDSRETIESVETKKVTESENEQDSIKSSISINKDKWTKDSPKQNPNTAYVFTENINSIGSSRVGGGSDIIRNNPNAIGIITKKYYVYREDRATGYRDWETHTQY